MNVEEVNIVNRLKQNWHHIVLFFIMFLSGFLSFYEAWNEGYSNWFYSSAVKSMLQSWHNFFFASFDPGGFITVDKPVLGLWIQTLSAFIFGFHGWSLILPESIATVISVILLYHLVQRSFGKTTGLISALILALTPIFEVVGRVNNLDAILIMTLLFATWALIVAAEKGSFLMLLISMMLIGLGYNVKMLEAYMVLPTLYIVYMLMAAIKFRKRLLHLIGATIILVTTSLSWSVIVDLTPVNQRPYIGGSNTNSLIELALGYNGIHRLISSKDQGAIGIFNKVSGNKNTVNSQSKVNNSKYGLGIQNKVNDDPNINKPTKQDAGKSGLLQENSPNALNIEPERKQKGGAPHGNSSNSQNIGASGGQQGIFRIFNKELGGQIAWFIPIALFGILISLLRMNKKDDKDKSTVLRNILLWAMWFAPMYIYFSISSLFHPYYTAILSPSIAALTGIGLVEMWHAYLDKGWKGYILPIAFVINGSVQGIILSRYATFGKILIPIVCGFSFLSALIIIGIKRFGKNKRIMFAKALVAIEFFVLLITPLVWTCTPIVYGFSNKTLPYTGPDLPGAPDVIIQQSGYSNLTKFLLDQRKNEKYLIAVPRSVDAAPIILQTGYPVIAYGGFQGTDKALTVDKLEEMVNGGELRYIQINSSKGGGQQSEIAKWVTEHGKVVSTDEYENSENGQESDFKVNGSNLTLYDLAQ